MCGISGIALDALDPRQAVDLTASMSLALSHRGPDDAGLWAGQNAVLAHRRLSIIDVSPQGRQPMLSADGRCVLVCNGEIYNYPEIRQRYLDQGYPFQSQSDSEILLPLYQEFGPDCVDHLVGMFAFAIWDESKKRLLLARDRIGEKPLYTCETPQGLAFGSEIKALLQLPWIQRRMDPEAMANLLIYPHIPAPLTIFEGIRALPPASVLIWDREMRRSQVSSYWRIDFSRRRPWRPGEALERYEELIRRAVHGCMLADVPLGFFLSGGVDSSTTAALGLEKRADIQTFCVGLEGGAETDPEFVRSSRVAEILGTRHRNIPFRSGDLPLLPQVLLQYDQPYTAFPMIFAHILAGKIREHVKVVISGNGADEIFLGYEGYHRMLPRQQLYRLGRFIPAALARLLPAKRQTVARQFLQAAKGPVHGWRAGRMDLLFRELLDSYATEAFAQRWRGHSPGRFIAEHVRASGARTMIDSVWYSDLMVYHHHGHAAISDISGMTHGLEIRSPFLDHRLIEFAASLPHDLLLPSWRKPELNKHLMKRFLSRYLPDEIVYAPKLGLGQGIDLGALIRGPWAAVMQGQLLRERFLDLGIFSREGIAQALAHAPQQAWLMLVVSVWADLFLDRENPEAIAERLTPGAGATPTGRPGYP